MIKRIVNFRTILASVALVLALTVRPGVAAPLQQARSVITYPSDGMTVSGAVEIQGIATHPNINSYQVRYAAGPQPTGDSCSASAANAGRAGCRSKAYSSDRQIAEKAISQRVQMSDLERFMFSLLDKT